MRSWARRGSGGAGRAAAWAAVKRRERTGVAGPAWGVNGLPGLGGKKESGPWATSGWIGQLGHEEKLGWVEFGLGFLGFFFSISNSIEV